MNSIINQLHELGELYFGTKELLKFGMRTEHERARTQAMHNQAKLWWDDALVQVAEMEDMAVKYLQKVSEDREAGYLKDSTEATSATESPPEPP